MAVYKADSAKRQCTAKATAFDLPMPTSRLSEYVGLPRYSDSLPLCSAMRAQGVGFLSTARRHYRRAVDEFPRYTSVERNPTVASGPIPTLAWMGLPDSELVAVGLAGSR